MKQTEIKQRKEPGSNGQYYVVVHKRKEWKALFEWLIEKGFDNIRNLSKYKRPKMPPAIVIDKRRNVFFLTNVCCLACAASVGDKAITCSEFYEYYEKTK